MLDGNTVLYGSASELKATLEYDFTQEQNFSYKDLTMNEIIHHLAVFISPLWQIHIFEEEKQYIELELREMKVVLEQFDFSNRTNNNIIKLYKDFGSNTIFGRADICLIMIL